MSGYLRIMVAVFMLFGTSLSQAQSFRAQPVSRLLKVKVAQAEPGVKSYREWKAEKIHTAQARISNLKVRMELTKQSRQVAQGDPNNTNSTTVEGGYLTNTTLATLEKQLQQEQYALEFSQDLSVTDYFVGYLTKLPNQQKAVQEVAARLSPDEVAELMIAYSKMFPQSAVGSEKPQD